MKHATSETLVVLLPLLTEVRRLGPLVERTPGAFYLKSQAFLHFHEDPSGVFADVKLDLARFSRMRVTSQTEQSAFLERVRHCLLHFEERRSSAAAALNKRWHEANRMPQRPTAEQRIEWHLAHTQNCGCRAIPAGVLALMQTRGMQTPDPSTGSPAECKATYAPLNR